MAWPGSSIDGAKLLTAIQAVVLSPRDAQALVDGYRQEALAVDPNRDPRQVQELVATKVIERFTWMTTTSGAVTALPGVVPGLGTGIAVGGAFGDAVVCMKLQVDMCLALCGAFNYDLEQERTRHLAFLLAAGGTLEKHGVEGAHKMASEDSVRLVRQYLEGAATEAVKQLFKRIGLTLTRKALQRILPFGIGVALGAGANYAMTRYVGDKATRWLLLDRDTPRTPSPEETAAT